MKISNLGFNLSGHLIRKYILFDFQENEHAHILGMPMSSLKMPVIYYLSGVHTDKNLSSD